MQLYSGPSTHFIRDTTHNQIAEKLKSAFFAQYRYEPPPGEAGAWRNSLRATAQVFQEAGLTDHGVMLEYRLPLTSKRLDCIVCGRREDDQDNAVIIELKQWDHASEAIGDKLVSTWVGGAEREVLHPSAQVGQYQMYLQDTHTAFHEGESPVALGSCAYLHNYVPTDDDVLFAEPFAELVREHPVFSADDVPRLKDFLVERLSAGQGIEVLRRVEESRYRPSKKLMDHVGNVIRGKPEYVLLDEQLVVYEKVLHCARAGFHDRRKHVLIVKGGPGTGKSVIAMNLLGDLLLEGYNAHYASGSRAFTGTLRSGRPGPLPAPGSLRSGRARLTHPAPRIRVSLQTEATSARRGAAGAGSVRSDERTDPTASAPCSSAARATCAKLSGPATGSAPNTVRSP